MVAGTILLLIGGAMFMVGYSISQQYSTSLGQLAYTFSQYQRQNYQTGLTLMIVGGVIALLGFAMIIGGAAAGSGKPSTTTVHITQPQPSQPIQTPSVSGINIEYCYHCGGSMPAGSQFCKKCGRSQRSNLPNIQQQSPTHSTAIYNCPDCGKRLTYMYSSQNWYCGTCEKNFA